jgi:hypothetical protein
MPAYLRFAAVQIASVVGLVVVLAFNVPFGFALLLASLVAGFVAWRCYPEAWWIGIHAAFLPLVFGAQTLQLPSYMYLIAFVACWLFFGRIAHSRVPFFLSEQQVLQQLADCLPANASFLDVGAGSGRVLAFLARHRPDLHLAGVEYAYLPWLIGRCFLAKKIEWIKADYQAIDFSRFDCVYAYLSPAAMPALWLKASNELKAGSWLLSNSFEIAGQTPSEVFELADWKNGKLLIWQM